MEVIIIRVRETVGKRFLPGFNGKRIANKQAGGRAGRFMMTQRIEGRPPTAPVIYCDESRRLLEAFGEAVQRLLILHEQQFLAIVDGDLECHRFDLLIHMANERKQEAKYAYMHHVETHGCSLINNEAAY